MWCSPSIPTFRKPSFSFFGEPLGGQSFDSTSRGGSIISTSSGQVGLLRKKPRIEVPVSAPQLKTATTNQLSQSTQVGMLVLPEQGPPKSSGMSRLPSWVERLSFMKRLKTDFKNV